MKKYIKLLLILGIAFNMMHGKALADQSVSGDISSGSYVRQTDGLNGEKFTISGKPGGDLNISGGSFSTASPQIYTNGVTTVRDDNIRLYNPDSKDPVTGLYSLHTKETVEQAYKDGKEAQFAPANNPTAIPTKEEVLKALEAAQDLEAAAKVTAWEIKADGDINVTGGSFDFMTANQSSIAAGGKLNWKNASLVSAGGGGALTIKAPDGINIESGSIRSEGQDLMVPMPKNMITVAALTVTAGRWAATCTSRRMATSCWDRRAMPTVPRSTWATAWCSSTAPMGARPRASCICTAAL